MPACGYAAGFAYDLARFDAHSRHRGGDSGGRGVLGGVGLWAGSTAPPVAGLTRMVPGIAMTVRQLAARCGLPHADSARLRTWSAAAASERPRLLSHRLERQVSAEDDGPGPGQLVAV